MLVGLQPSMEPLASRWRRLAEARLSALWTHSNPVRVCAGAMTQAAFLSPLIMQTIGERRWLLTNDLAFHSVRLDGVFVVSRGFQTDLASTPRLAWTMFPPVGLWDAPAVLHDAAYAGALTTLNRQRVWLIKPLADTLFREALLASGVSAWRAQVMYWAVKLAGDPLAHPLAAHAKAT